MEKFGLVIVNFIFHIYYFGLEKNVKKTIVKGGFAIPALELGRKHTDTKCRLSVLPSLRIPLKCQ